MFDDLHRRASGPGGWVRSSWPREVAVNVLLDAVLYELVRAAV
jgi:hypothetical protein